MPIVLAMHITGQTRVFMILGDPVAQVRAPELFNPLFRRHGIDAVLVPAQARRLRCRWPNAACAR